MLCCGLLVASFLKNTSLRGLRGLDLNCKPVQWVPYALPGVPQPLVLYLIINACEEMINYYLLKLDVVLFWLKFCCYFLFRERALTQVGENISGSLLFRRKLRQSLHLSEHGHWRVFEQSGQKIQASSMWHPDDHLLQAVCKKKNCCSVWQPCISVRSRST